MKILPALTLLLILTPSCQDKSLQDDSKPAPSAATPASEHPEPQAIVPDAPLPAIPLGETPTILFSAKSGVALAGIWDLVGEQITLRTRVDKQTPSSYDATLLVSVPDVEESRVLTCEDLKIAAGAYVSVMLRGPQLHVLCVRPPVQGDLGWTKAGRFSFDADKLMLVRTGTYEGEGLVDPDTIDLDEGDEQH